MGLGSLGKRHGMVGKRTDLHIDFFCSGLSISRLRPFFFSATVPSRGREGAIGGPLASLWVSY